MSALSPALLHGLVSVLKAPDADAEARLLHKVARIGPDSINTPARVWA